MVKPGDSRGSKAAREKGKRGERAVAQYLRANGLPNAKRSLRLGDNVDEGDQAGIPDCVAIQVKDHVGMNLAGWLEEADTQAANKHADLPVVWHKRMRKACPGDWYVTMSGETLTKIMRILLVLEHSAENGKSKAWWREELEQADYNPATRGDKGV